MPGEHRCSQCYASYPNPSKLQRHMETHMITGDWLCGLCNTLSLRLNTLIQHWKITCPEFKQVFCDEDRKAMTNDEIQEAAFRLTLDRYSSENQLDYEEPGPSNRVSYENRSKSSICVYCSLHFPRGTLSTHYGVHANQHGPGTLTQSSKVPYVCDLCGYGFRFKKSLYKHWRTKCWELLAHCSPDGMTIDNRELRKMVGDLVKQAEMVAPYDATANVREEETLKNYEDQEDDEMDEDTHPSYESYIMPPTIPPPEENQHYWNVGNQQNPQSCHPCTRRFHSNGRLQLHIDAFHDDKRAFIECELCLVRFSENRILMTHLRTNCRAMKVEEPSNEKRKKMSALQIMSIVEEARDRWRALFEKKKVENLKYITEYIENIDNKMPQMEDKLVPILDVPVPRENFEESPSDVNYCGLCKIKFNSSRFLYQHQLAVHSNQSSRNQITITATSLLPYFKLEQAVFYDSSGAEYRMGKLLETGKDFTKHLQNRMITAGARVENMEESNCFIVPLFGKNCRHVLLNQEEILNVCDADGRLKSLFIENPCEYDDIPILTRETYRV